MGISGILQMQPNVCAAICGARVLRCAMRVLIYWIDLVQSPPEVVPSGATICSVSFVVAQVVPYWARDAAAL